MKDLSPPDHVGPLVGHDASYGGGGTSVLTEPFPPLSGSAYRRCGNPPELPFEEMG